MGASGSEIVGSGVNLQATVTGSMIVGVSVGGGGGGYHVSATVTSDPNRHKQLLIDWVVYLIHSIHCIHYTCTVYVCVCITRLQCICVCITFIYLFTVIYIAHFP